MRTIEQLRAEARDHARQLEAVLWLSVQELAARWGVSSTTVREIDRETLPYLTLGKTAVRRYHPDDVATFEAHERAPAPATEQSA